MKKVLFILLLLIILLLLLFYSNWFWQHLYPLKYKELITENARKFNLDPYLVASIIYVESKFNPDACSAKGALGLMQIMPETGAWIASMLEVNDYKAVDLYRPEKNIYFGSWYLASLKRQFNDEMTVVLAAYNAGRGNVSGWLKKEWDGQENTVADLPFPETRNFVEKVKKVYKIYKKIYNIPGEASAFY